MFAKQMYFVVFAFLIAMHFTAGQEQANIQNLVTRQFQPNLFNINRFGTATYNNNIIYRNNNNYFYHFNGRQFNIAPNFLPSGYGPNNILQYPTSVNFPGLSIVRNRLYQGQYPLYRYNNGFGYFQNRQFFGLPNNFVLRRSVAFDGAEEESVA
ncbi:uncharacterized protein MELLADRAFT_105173 [Melampsora larici-populina 98AG31]|uniref:Secreted protein n=1 Tax=Melampsora larici-populina (strain 98AG31 / pathotype 3-4-7) TaxID=747676 RepID=F4RGV3_MELLP|nr:uncharacterized protein MELLADRAFT_105173 [Melampsora larici-populina 98AG31]EGG08205.1 secreted protein [Melampsora larici-populina 98AG31]